MKKVAIAYGWTEGPWQSKRLRHELRKAGFAITRFTNEADIIIAHSGGCYMLPETGKANVILLVGLPYWPGRRLRGNLYRKVRHDSKDVWWLKKTFFNTYYLFTRPRKWINMWRLYRKFNLPFSTNEKSVIALRNDDDTFMHPLESVVLAEKRGWHAKTLTGHHDDIWLNPKPYVAIIREFSENYMKSLR